MSDEWEYGVARYIGDEFQSLVCGEYRKFGPAERHAINMESEHKRAITITNESQLEDVDKLKTQLHDAMNTMFRVVRRPLNDWQRIESWET